MPNWWYTYTNHKFHNWKGSVRMTKIDIYSGFLGAGKTTLIKKMIREAYKGEKLVLIENEFITNPYGMETLMSSIERNAFCGAVTQGIADYFAN